MSNPTKCKPPNRSRQPYLCTSQGPSVESFSGSATLYCISAALEAGALHAFRLMSAGALVSSWLRRDANLRDAASAFSIMRCAKGNPTRLVAHVQRLDTPTCASKSHESCCCRLHADCASRGRTHFLSSSFSTPPCSETLAAISWPKCRCSSLFCIIKYSRYHLRAFLKLCFYCGTSAAASEQFYFMLSNAGTGLRLLQKASQVTLADAGSTLRGYE